MPLHVVLVEPEIPQNTGNIARTCVATGAMLHLVHPLGFHLTDRHLRRAGMDYWERVMVREHASWTAFRQALPGLRLWLAAGSGVHRHTEVAYQDGDALVFGRESTGLPDVVLAAHREQTVRLPMCPGTRSLNVSSAVAAMVYEALRQIRPAWW